MRYLWPGGGKGLTASEYADLKAHGLDVGLVYEGTATGMLNGRNQGISDARAAQAQIEALGLPADSVVYWAADFDCYTTGQFAACDAYVDGWLAIIPLARTGGYGGLYYLQHVHATGRASYLWECASTSFRHGVSPASVPLHLQQTTLTPPVSDCDLNNVIQANYGQIGALTPTTPTIEIIQEADMPLLVHNVTDSTMHLLGDKPYTFGQEVLAGGGYTAAQARDLVEKVLKAEAGTATDVNALELAVLEQIWSEIYPQPATSASAPTIAQIETAISTELGKVSAPAVSASELQTALSAALKATGLSVDATALAAALAPLLGQPLAQALGQHLAIALTSK